MKKSGDKQTQTDKHTTPTRGRIIVADGIYSVGDKKINSRQHPMDDVKNLQNGNHLAKIIISA
jgi:hypothetical protein